MSSVTNVSGIKRPREEVAVEEPCTKIRGIDLSGLNVLADVAEQTNREEVAQLFKGISNFIKSDFLITYAQPYVRRLIDLVGQMEKPKPIYELYQLGRELVNRAKVMARQCEHEKLRIIASMAIAILKNDEVAKIDVPTLDNRYLRRIESAYSLYAAGCHYEEPVCNQVCAIFAKIMNEKSYSYRRFNALIIHSSLLFGRNQGDDRAVAQQALDANLLKMPLPLRGDAITILKNIQREKAKDRH